MKTFKIDNPAFTNQFINIAWIEESGVSENELRTLYDELMKEDGKESRALLKAKLFALLCEKSRLAIDKEDIFQDKLFDGNLLNEQRDAWYQEVTEERMPELVKELFEAEEYGAFNACADFGHTSPNSKLLLSVGFQGLLDRIERAEQNRPLENKQRDFYNSCKIILKGCIAFLLRLAQAIAPYNEENAQALINLAKGAPTNSYEAMQLLIVYFFLHEYIYKTRVRTLGRLDVLLQPFFERDLQKGTFTKAEIKEMLKFFLHKFSAAKVDYGLPFCLGGVNEQGEEVTSEISYLIVETYTQLNIYSPKIHIRVSDKTPKSFLQLVLQSIRGGQSSFVFCNDAVAIRSLMRVGIEEKDARDYTPIGCYEPAVWGKEIGCTGNAGVNLAKAIEFVFSGGVDIASGKRLSIPSANLDTFEEFYTAVKEQISFMTNKCLEFVREVEKHYGEIGPDPFLSSMYDDCVLQGVDAMEGGATYNNSSICFHAIASLVDCLTAVKKFVYDEKRVSLEELFEILKTDWAGQERLRLLAKKIPEKYGNENETADLFTKDLASYCAALVNNQPNSRGGVFKASLFSIDRCFYYGKRTMATPDGRKAGDPLSKNLCTTLTMDKNGVLAFLNSVTEFDHADYPNGSVADIVLHPSAVKGEDGLEAFYGILKTYFAKGGFALHGNVFTTDDLYAAQENPDAYSTLQVRVCGWNAYFVSLSKEEQDAFIRQAETSFL